MPILPILQTIEIRNFGIFPGTDQEPGIKRDIDAGVTLIAGINGLGKTTLLMVILRMLTGPCDLTGSGLPVVGSTLPESAPRLNRDALRFFAQRVAGDARGATASLAVRFGPHEFTLTRRLDNLQLIDARIDGRPLAALDEVHYQAAVREMMGLSSFVDVLLVLHHTIFFPEGRPGALWDRNAQRQLLRAILLPPEAAAKIAELERQVGSADSAARNTSAQLYTARQNLEEAQALQAAAPGVRAEVKSKQTLFQAAEGRQAALDERRKTVTVEMRAVELDLERARIDLDEARRAVERLKYESISRVFPKLEDAALLTVLTLLSSGDCLVCGAHAEQAKADLEALLARGDCPVCESPPSEQANVIAPHEVEASRLQKLRRRLAKSIDAEAGLASRNAALRTEYDMIINEAKTLSTELDQLDRDLKGLDAKLPRPTQEVLDLQAGVKTLETALERLKTRRAVHAAELRGVLGLVQTAAEEKTGILEDAFGRYAVALLSEEARLVRDTVEAGIAQQDEAFAVPSFFAEMTSATKPGLSRRRSPGDVSESQRELIDLAFRFALLEAAEAAGASTLVMETPEASLDEYAMERVGKALFDFAQIGENRLVATSNLTNAGMIAWLFGGPSKSKAELRRRHGRTINLLEIGAKNKALRDDATGRYAALLDKSLTGRS